MQINPSTVYKELDVSLPHHQTFSNKISIRPSFNEIHSVNLSDKEKLLNFTFEHLIKSHVEHHLDYIIALVEDSIGETSVFDGCRLVRNYFGLADEISQEKIKKASFYQLDISEENLEFTYLCNLSELDDKKNLTFIGACDQNAERKQELADDQFAVGVWYQKKGKLNHAFRWYLNAASNGSPEAYTRLAHIFENGLAGQPKSSDKTLKCWQKALELLKNLPHDDNRKSSQKINDYQKMVLYHSVILKEDKK